MSSRPVFFLPYEFLVRVAGCGTRSPLERCGFHEHKHNLFHRFCCLYLDGRSAPYLPDETAATADGQLQVANHVPGLRLNHSSI